MVLRPRISCSFINELKGWDSSPPLARFNGRHVIEGPCLKPVLVRDLNRRNKAASESDLFTMKNFATQRNWNHPKEFFLWPFFSLLHKEHVIYHAKFSTDLFLYHLTHKIYYFSHKIYYFFLLVSLLEMVLPRAARPRLSTPLGRDKPLAHRSGHEEG